MFFDIFFIGYYVIEMVGVVLGDSVVIVGVGLVGLMVVLFVMIKGVVKVMVVDCYFDWFVLVEQIGVIVIDDFKVDFV